jgi:hypothetical protein
VLDRLGISRKHGVHALDERVKLVHVRLQELFGRRPSANYPAETNPLLSPFGHRADNTRTMLK